MKRAAEPHPHARSLNLANAASIALYEAYRQVAGARAEDHAPAGSSRERSAAGVAR